MMKYLLLIVLLLNILLCNSYKSLVISYNSRYKHKFERLLLVSQIDDIETKPTFDQYNGNFSFADYISHVDNDNNDIENNNNKLYFPFNETIFYNDGNYDSINSDDEMIGHYINSNTNTINKDSTKNTSSPFPKGSKRAAVMEFFKQQIPPGSKRRATADFLRDMSSKISLPSLPSTDSIMASLNHIDRKGKETVSFLLKNNDSFLHTRMQEDIKIKQIISDSLKSFKAPWDVHYRAPIPFFEPTTNSMDQQSQSDNLISSIMLDSDSSSSSSSSSSLLSSTTITAKKLDIVKKNTENQLKKVFPVTFGVLNLRSKLAKINTGRLVVTVKNGVKSLVLTVAPGIKPTISLVRSTKDRFNRFLEERPGLIPGYLRNQDVFNSNTKRVPNYLGFDEEQAGLLSSSSSSSSSSIDLLHEYNPKINVPLPLITDYDQHRDTNKDVIINENKQTTSNSNSHSNSNSNSHSHSHSNSHSNSKQPEYFLYGDIDISFDNDNDVTPIPLVHDYDNEPLRRPVSLLVNTNTNTNTKDIPPKVKVTVSSVSSSFPVMKIDESRNSTVMLRSSDFLPKPFFVKVPSRGDLNYLKETEEYSALSSALAITCPQHADEYMKYIGLKPLIKFLINSEDDLDLRRQACKAVCRICRQKKEVAHIVGQNDAIIKILIDMIEAPFKGFQRFKSQSDRDLEKRVQLQAVSLVHRLVRSSDIAVTTMRSNPQLRRVLIQLMDEGDASKVISKHFDSDGAHTNRNRKNDIMIKHNDTRIVDFAGRTVYQMARVAAWGIGGVPWRPKFRGHKGIRILSFDGGGTRGVLSVALLKELMIRVGGPKALFEMFDIICGTSTGGIIAVLLGGQQVSINEAQVHYDDLISKVFGKKSNIKLISEQASYDEHELERILYSFCGDELFLDTNKKDCPRVFCVSTKVNNNPPLPMIWRNYNYPPNQASRYPGQFRINTVTAVRATSAAPTFFTPVPLGGGLYCDGALVANNPTAIAVQEAKSLYPGVPLELVLSVGTGNYCEDNKAQVMGWDLLVNQIIASAVDSEEVHKLLYDLLPSSQYYRLNPVLHDNLAIDEKNPKTLNELKTIAHQFFKDWENNIVDDGKRLDNLIKLLKGL